MTMSREWTLKVSPHPRAIKLSPKPKRLLSARERVTEVCGALKATLYLCVQGAEQDSGERRRDKLF